MITLYVMAAFVVVMFCVQIAYCIYFEHMLWYWAVFHAVIVYSAVVFLLAAGGVISDYRQEANGCIKAGVAFKNTEEDAEAYRRAAGWVVS
tara:strand:+ start:622 stop:894 length:273 start_codon:yes stop_codon:yes gene_type:complete